MRQTTETGLSLLTAALLALPLALPSACGPSEATPGTPSPTPTLLDDIEDLFEDTDGDGAIARDDCDDDDASVYPGATEACDGVDNDCDEGVDEGFDRDSDGAYDAEACASIGGDDCDDTSAGVAPGEDERCDEVDEDCDGLIDESPVDGDTYWTDQDGDSFGDPDDAFTACTQPEGSVTNDLDCNGDDGAVSPSAREACDGIDNDCDESIDEEVLISYYLDADEDGFGDDATLVQACTSPGDEYVTAGGDCDDNALNVNPGQSEFCDGIDNNCDGLPDDSSAANADLYYEDTDGDGYGDPDSSDRFCEPVDGWARANLGEDCNDDNNAINPGAEDVCGDSIDQDCSGSDEVCP